MKTGAIILLVLAALVMLALLELGKNVIWGWLLTAVLLIGFVLLYPRIGAKSDRQVAWLGLILFFALILKLSLPPYRAIPAVEGKNPAVTGVVTVAQGDLTGLVSEDGAVEVYAGVPYAKPPVGELRWKEPQEPEHWEGVRACDRFAPMSMQKRHSELYNTLYDLIGYHKFSVSLDDNFREPVSEDSLYLNIWKPAGDAEKLPVIFFIHGGSLMTGQPSFTDYNGESLARKGVIVVNVGYRLGVFGFFASEELAAESPNGTTGNYGLLDQIAALRWVHENIAAFGGDPDNITIAGESAGASCVNALCVSPLTEGLFRRAIAESSGITAVQPYHTFRTMDEALDTGRKIMDEWEAENVSELRVIPAEQLVQTIYANDSLTVDGYSLTEMPYLSYEKGLNHEEALLNGFNGHEAEAFRILQSVSAEDYPALVGRLLGDEAERYIALYPAGDKAQTTENFNRLLSVCWFAYSHCDWSRRLTEQGRPVYEYYFTRQNGAIGDMHSGEMIYAYGNLWRSPRNYNEDDLALSETMQRYWVNFARCGDPNGEGLPAWPTVAEAPGNVLNFDVPVQMIPDPYAEIYPIVDERQNSLK
ncbi:MAG: carboxylesterase family protein [Oscillospiraceae bacterium]|nr:carboxylesterase family protein [Oscillospiraceae bacterium]